MGGANTSTAVAAGWYPCPHGRGQRWWDGAHWTDGWLDRSRTTSLAGAPSPGARLHEALEHGFRPKPRPATIALASNEQVYAFARVELFGLTVGDDAQVRPAWVALEHGSVHLTDFRLVLQLSGGFANVPYTAVADSVCEPDGFCLWPRHQAPVKLVLADPEWHFVLFRWLAYGEPAAVDAA
jgi:hypothetical protein